MEQVERWMECGRLRQGWMASTDEWGNKKENCRWRSMGDNGYWLREEWMVKSGEKDRCLQIEGSRYK